MKDKNTILREVYDSRSTVKDKELTLEVLIDIRDYIGGIARELEIIGEHLRDIKNK